MGAAGKERLMDKFAQTVLDLLHHGANKVDIQTDNQGQLIIYTGLAQMSNGELVIFDPNAPEGSYKTD